MRLLVISDSHYNKTMLENIYELILNTSPKFDAVAHLGDMITDTKLLTEKLRIPVYAVPGNCDCFCHEIPEKTVMIGKLRTFLCHGHTLHVKSGTTALSYRAEEQMAKLVLYGHTHVPDISYCNDMVLVNPGALKDGNYAVVEADDTGVTKVRLLSL